MNKKCKILIFCTVFVVETIVAQENTVKVNAVKDFMKSYYAQPALLSLRYVPQKVLSPNFYVKNLGFFCKQELKFEAATGIPFKFRLGSVQYCDWMEGKKNTGSLPPMQY
jgi:hypothetical protein